MLEGSSIVVVAMLTRHCQVSNNKKCEFLKNPKEEFKYSQETNNGCRGTKQ